MPYVRETSPNVFAAIDPNATIVVRENGRPDVQWPPSIVDMWDSGALAAIGIYRVTSAPVPAGQEVIARHYEREGDQVVEVLDLAPVVPSSLTRAQLLLGLLSANLITADEAIAAAQTGAVPAFIVSHFEAMQDPDRTAAYVKWASSPAFHRADPLLLAMAQATGITSAQLDQYFIQAAAM